MKSLCTLGLALAMPGVAWAKDLSGLYDTATLAHWQPRYQRGIEWNFRHVLPILTPAERQALAGVRLRYPLVGEAEGDPLEFYSSVNPSGVSLPVLSLKFFDDLCVAYAWLARNGYSLESVTDYVAMLKYRNAADLPGGRYPPPLQALRIPANALDNPKVDDLAQKIFKSAVVWILAHELGHIVYRHPGYAPGVPRSQARANEEAADRFATEIMRRIGEAPTGLTFFFMVAAHWWPNRGDFPSNQAWESFLIQRATHPFTAERLLALARRMTEAASDFARTEADHAVAMERVRYISAQLSQIAEILQDTGVQRSMVVKALATDLASLAPRRPGELLAKPGPERPGGPRPAASFHGGYRGRYVRTLPGNEREELPINLLLERRGEQVNGRYSFGLGEGLISGLVRGETLYFDWQWGASFGRGTLRAADGGSASSGTWGYGESRENGGTLDARKQ